MGRFDRPDEHSNGPMSSLRLRMNSLGIRTVSNGINECMMETGWHAMTKAERMFLTKGNWQIEWKLSPNAKEKNLVHDLVNVYDWILLPMSVGAKYTTSAVAPWCFTCFPMHNNMHCS